MLEFWTFSFLVILNILHTGHSILTQEDSSPAPLITLDIPRSDQLDEILEHELRLLQTKPDKNEIVKLVVDQDISKDESNLSSHLKPIVKQRLDVSKLKPNSIDKLHPNTLDNEKFIANLVQSSNKSANGSKPFLVYPLPTNKYDECILRNRSTSFRIDESSKFEAKENDKEFSSNFGQAHCTIIVEKAVPSICQLSLQFHEPVFNYNAPEDQNLLNNIDISENPEYEELCNNNGIQVHVSKNGFNGSKKICNFTKEFHIFPFEENIIRIDLPTNMLDFSEYNLNFTVRQIACSDHHLRVDSMQDRSTDIDLHGTNDHENWPEENALARANFPQGCNQVIDQEEFVLQSPNYPSKYPNNIDCTTIVYPSSNNICALELTFDEFRVEESLISPDECDRDYLEISDAIRASGGSSPNPPIKYCGRFTGIKLIDIDVLKRIVFHSDEANRDIGYSIHVRQEPCKFPNPSTPSSRTTVFPTYSPSTRDTTDLPTYSSTSKRPVPEFPDYDGSGFEDASLINLRTSNVAITKKLVENEEQGLIIRSENVFNNIVENELSLEDVIDTALINSTSEDTTLSYELNESDTIQESEKSSKVSSKLKKQLQEKDAIETTTSINLEQEFLTNHMKSTAIIDTEANVVQQDGRKSNSSNELLGTLSNIRKIVNVSTDSNTNVLGNEISELRDQLKCSEVFHLSSESHNISSPNFPLTYPENIECVYAIMYLPDETCGIQITYNKFSLSCFSGDYLEIENERICGNQRGTKLYATNEKGLTLIRFSSDDNITDDGFDLEIGPVYCEGQESLVFKEEFLEKTIPLTSGEYFPAENSLLDSEQQLDKLISKPDNDLEDAVEEESSGHSQDLTSPSHLDLPSIIDREKNTFVLPGKVQEVVELISNEIDGNIGIFQDNADEEKQLSKNLPSAVEEVSGNLVKFEPPSTPSPKFLPPLNGKDLEGPSTNPLTIDINNKNPFLQSASEGKNNFQPAHHAQLPNSIRQNVNPTNALNLPQRKPLDTYGSPFGPTLVNDPQILKPQPNPIPQIIAPNQKPNLIPQIITPNQKPNRIPQIISPNQKPLSTIFDSYGAPIAPSLKPLPQNIQPNRPHVSENVQPHQTKRPRRPQYTDSYGIPFGPPVTRIPPLLSQAALNNQPLPRPQNIRPNHAAIPQHQNIIHHHSGSHPSRPSFIDGYAAPLAPPLTSSSQYKHPNPSPRPTITPHHPHPIPQNIEPTRPISPIPQNIDHHKNPRPPQPKPSYSRPLQPIPQDIDPNRPIEPIPQNIEHHQHSRPPHPPQPKPSYHPRPIPQDIRPTQTIVPIPQNIEHHHHQRPQYYTNPKPSYDSNKSRTPRFLEAIGDIFNAKAQFTRNILRGKAQAINSFFSLFKRPVILRRPNTKPSYHHKPSYNLPSYKPPLSQKRSDVELNDTKINPFKSHNLITLTRFPNHIVESNFEDTCQLFNWSERHQKDETLFLQSPKYPNDYNNSLNCSASIQATQDICYLNLKFLDFILEDSLYCQHDYLLVESLRGNEEPQRMCGQHSGEELVFKNRGKFWKFELKTDSSGVQRGFKISVNFIPC